MTNQYVKIVENRCNKFDWNKGECQANLVNFIKLKLSEHMNLHVRVVYLYIKFEKFNLLQKDTFRYWSILLEQVSPLIASSNGVLFSEYKPYVVS